MAPKSPWNRKTTLETNVQNAGDVASPAIDYAAVQAEEIDALRAIYMEDFEEGAVNTGAWGKTTDHSFKLTIKPISEDAKAQDFVVLSVKLTATYPKSAPVLQVQGLDKFHERTQKRIRNVLQYRSKQMLGEVMIYAISSEIQEALDDAVSARAQGTLPSLEEERASAEEVAQNLAKEAEEAEIRRQQEEREEEDRVLNQMVQEEVNRRDKRKSSKPAGDTSKLETEQDFPETIVFDQAAKVKVRNELEPFTEVAVDSLLSERGKESTYLGRPKIASVSGSALVTIVRRKVEKSRGDIIELEAVLEKACSLDHAGLVNLLAFRMDRINNFNSELILCREYADRGSLHELLSLCDLHVSKSRQFTVQLLEALDFLHHNGMVHGAIATRSILLSTNPSFVPKLAEFGYGPLIGLQNSDLPHKWRSPETELRAQSSQRYSDLWDLGIVIVQMFLGLSTIDEYPSPSVLMGRLELSDTFEDFLSKIFLSDTKKRPSCFDLLPAEFLRTDTPVLQQVASRHGHHSRKSSSGFASPLARRSRHNSSNLHEPFSRYANDFTDLGRLGKGGFGEVVKARNKLDGGVYAVKKIRQAPQLLEQVLKEVMLLNRLNHPYVVRYYSTWVENDMPASIQEEAVSTTEETVSDGPTIDFGYASTGGLDFVSSTGFPGLEFGDDDEDDDDENDEVDNDNEEDIFERDSQTDDLNGTSTTDSRKDNLNGEVRRFNKPRSDSRRMISTLYIQMELCDRRSLRDLIRRGMDEDDSWRMMRQITEGLAHIHEHGIIHRDLKPDNVFIDSTGNPKIGDFGLATTGNYSTPHGQLGSAGYGSVDMTRSIGTALYVAPELQSNSGGSYDDKVDMFSLGIMFFEMCQAFGTAMERINEIQTIRKKDHELPAPFQATGDKAPQGKVISCLISHKPSERPSSAKLLRSDILPVKIEDETIRQALSGLSDPRSPYHQKLMSALFAHDAASNHRVKARAWESKAMTAPEDINRVRVRGVARTALEAVFRRHGAEEGRRDSIFPRSGIYTNPNVVQLLDASGNLLQLPYDLTLPHAQQLARQAARVRCSFAFGGAYRDSFSGGPPKVSEEGDFDIVNVRDDDTSLNDAEVIKVMDEIVTELPTFESSANVSFQLNHGKLLDAVLNHCRVPVALQHVVKETLSKLGVHQNIWAKVRPELRNIGLSDSTLDDMQQFDWRDAPEKAFGRLRTLFEESPARIRSKADEAMQYLRRTFTFVQKFGIVRKLFVAPLSCVNAKFFENGMLFQCMLERKKNSIVIAAGGRYDSLIQSNRMPDAEVPRQGAVGITISMDYLIAHLLKTCSPESKSTFLRSPGHNHQLPKRCDVLIVANGTENLRDSAIKLVSNLWSHDISAELSHGSFPEQNYTFLVNMRHETSLTVRVTNTTTDSEDVDVPLPSLVSHLQQELRDQASNKSRRPLLRNHSSHQEGDRKANNVQVLMARHGSKKSNKYGIVEAAQQRWSEKLDQIKGAPILAIETRDEVLNIIRDTRLSDAESWRKAVQAVQLAERVYIGEVRDVLDSWRRNWEAADSVREVGVYNFRTGSCIYYDLGL